MKRLEYSMMTVLFRMNLNKFLTNHPFKGKNIMITLKKEETKIEKRRNHKTKHTLFQRGFLGLDKDHPEKEWRGQKVTVHNIQEALEAVTKI